MHKPPLTVEAFVAALAVLGCSRSADGIAPASEPNVKQQPAGAAAPVSPPKEVAPAQATPQATAQATAAQGAPGAQPSAGAAGAAPAADTKPRPPAKAAKPAVSAGTEVKPAATGRGAAGNGDQMTCTANGCSPDMKKPH
jgi:hypothetical protein